ncbi:MAG: Manganese transport system membrane protein MntB [Chloroflexota bacterium]|jgi:ABC-type Mn2+/Zn2+ transport system permease subunit|nr:MAG: Manganese transport system membrane protein MntB [Chloroflexota bacterium]
MLCALLVGMLCGVIGVYIVLRGMSYIGHGLSHAIFGGAVVSSLMSINFFIGASVWGFISAVLINLATKKKTIGADAAIGIITTASFALGIAIISKFKTFTRGFDAALFGNVLGITNADLIAVIFVTLFAFIIVLVFYKQLLFATFDYDVAKYYGVPVIWIDVIFSMTLAATIVVSMQVLGVTLIAAAVVIPAVVSRLLTNNFLHMLIFSTIIGGFCGLFGIYLSYYLDIASGASVVLFSSLLFIIALLYSTYKGRITRTINIRKNKFHL